MRPEIQTSQLLTKSKGENQTKTNQITKVLLQLTYLQTQIFINETHRIRGWLRLDGFSGCHLVQSSCSSSFLHHIFPVNAVSSGLCILFQAPQKSSESQLLVYGSLMKPLAPLSRPEMTEHERTSCSNYCSSTGLIKQYQCSWYHGVCSTKL